MAGSVLNSRTGLSLSGATSVYPAGMGPGVLTSDTTSLMSFAGVSVLVSSCFGSSVLVVSSAFFWQDARSSRALNSKATFFINEQFSGRR